jgi:membrane-bound lytic murein transglycosylase
MLLKILLSLIVISSCTRSPIKSSDEALRFARNTPELSAGLIDERFGDDLLKHIEFWETRKDLSTKTMKFGSQSIAATEYLAALKNLHAYIASQKDPAQRLKYLKENFSVMEVYGRSDWAEIFMTSYFSPVLEARTKPEGPYTEPLYARPSDLVEVDIKSFAQSPTVSNFRDTPEKTLLPEILRGRLVMESAQSSIPRIVPYYTRAEIQSGVLSKKKLELFYVDPIDSFILHIQGSGTIRVPGQADINVFRKEIYQTIAKEHW